MRRVYNYNTRKLYESADEINYFVNIEQKMLKDYDFDTDPDMDELIENGAIDTTYITRDEAADAIDSLIQKWCGVVGIEKRAFKVLNDGDVIRYILSPYIEFDFTIESDAQPIEENPEVEVEPVGESVSSRFAKLRSLFESDDEDEKRVDEGEEKSDDEKSDDEDKFDEEEEKKDDDEDEKKDDEEGDEDEKKDDEEEDDIEMKAVVITVNKGDEDKCKEELIKAGIEEEDIEIEEAEEDDDTVKIRIDVNSIMELKDYLSGKGIDLEKEIGGEIVDDSGEEEAEEDEEDEENDGEEDGEDKKDDEDEDGGDIDFNNLGDLFGAEE